MSSNYGNINYAPVSYTPDALMYDTPPESMGAPVTHRVLNPLQKRSMNILDNASKDVDALTTGITFMAQHPFITAQSGATEIGNWWNNQLVGNTNTADRVLHGAIDPIATLYTEPIVSGQNIIDTIEGKQSIGDLGLQAAANYYRNPVSSTLTALPLAGGLVKNVAKVGKAASTAAKAESILSGTTVDVLKDSNKIEEMSKALSDKYSLADLEEAIKAKAVGAEVSQELKPVVKDVSNWLDNYDESLAKYYKDVNFTPKEKMETAITQAFQFNEGQARIFQDVQKEIQPYLDLLQDKKGNDILKQLVSEGDDYARQVLNYKKLYDNKRLQIVPQAGIQAIEKFKEASDEGRRFAGRASSRAYGLATPAQIVEAAFKTPDKWLAEQLNHFTKTRLMEQILAGEIGAVEETTKDIGYITRESLDKYNQTGDVQHILDSMESIKKNKLIPPEDAIKVDRQLINELFDQLTMKGSGGNPFKNPWMADLYQLAKGVMLSSGKYLIGNAQTGIANMLINEGINPVNYIKDISAAVASKGRLSKKLGTYRTLTRTESSFRNPIIKGIHKYSGSEAIGNVMQTADIAMQNTFAEIAAHANLRRKGILPNQRANFLDGLKLNEVADVVRDVKLTALMNPTRILTPKVLRGTLATTNPFWRWYDTALQSTLYMYAKNPLLSYYVPYNVLSRIGFDEEMQNRLNLNVDSERPNVTYRFNNRTGKMEEVSMEFTPQMNTFKIAGAALKMLGTGDATEMQDRFGESIPFWTALYGAFKGVDKYNRPLLNKKIDSHDILNMRRVVDGQLYKYNPDNGQLMPTQADWSSGLNAILKETMAVPNLYNRTLAPISAAMLGTKFYAPYSGSLFGRFEGQSEVGNLVSGNPAKPLGLEDIGDTLTGSYAREYFKPRVNQKSLIRRGVKSDTRRQGRILRGGM